MLYNFPTGHYTHNKIAVAPWKSLSQDLKYAFIDSNTLPHGTVLLDPSKLRLANVASLWNLWVRRQKGNEQGLIFIKAQEEDKRRPSPAPVVPQASTRVALPRDPDEEDFFQNLSDEANDQEPHPESPAAHVESEDSKMKFLRGLSSEPTYIAFVDRLHSNEEVSFVHMPAYFVTKVEFCFYVEGRHHCCHKSTKLG